MSIWGTVTMVTKRGQQFTVVQNKYRHIFFSRKITFAFMSQKNAAIAFTSLVFKGINVNNSLRD